MSYICDNRLENPSNSDRTYLVNQSQDAGAAARSIEQSSPLSTLDTAVCTAQNRWSPYGLCSSPPARRRTAPASTVTAKDRFIPCRAPLDCKLSNYLLAASTDEQDYESTPSKQDYINTLKESILLTQGDAKVLPLRSQGGVDRGLAHMGGDIAVAGSAFSASKRRRTMRFIPKSPDKILDAPDLVDDYYLNLLDWSKSNILAVALRHCVFLWNASTGALSYICVLAPDVFFNT